MALDFKSHGEDLNHIAQGMAAAVEERMRSERMKTELITNVSHDIKTPLTSIINYADLIGKEPRDSEKIPEYAAVLTRQSERLKRLIEDLVEASKASTGNLEVNLAPCQPGVLLTQAAGEYEQKLKEAEEKKRLEREKRRQKKLARGEELDEEDMTEEEKKEKAKKNRQEPLKGDPDRDPEAEYLSSKERNRRRLAEARKKDAEKYGEEYIEVTDKDLM